MDTTYSTIAKPKYRSAPGTQARRETDWKVMSNDAIKFALDLANLHSSPHEGEILNEIASRIERGAWLDIDQHVPINAPDVPRIFYYFPFSLLWHQRRQR